MVNLLNDSHHLDVELLISIKIAGALSVWLQQPEVFQCSKNILYDFSLCDSRNRFWSVLAIHIDFFNWIFIYYDALASKLHGSYSFEIISALHIAPLPMHLWVEKHCNLIAMRYLKSSIWNVWNGIVSWLASISNVWKQHEFCVIDQMVICICVSSDVYSME